MSSELFNRGCQILKQQPFSVLLGTELNALDPGSAELRLAVRAEHLQQHGFVHGGVVSYLADNALTYAGAGGLQRYDVVTSEFKINYLRPALGDTLIARATVHYAGKTQAVCRCDIFTLDGGGEKICATAQGTIVPIGAAPATA